MGVLFMGAEFEDFSIGQCGYTTSSTFFDSNFARMAFQIGASSDYVAAPLSASSTELWAHVAIYTNFAFTSQRALVFCKSGGSSTSVCVGIKRDATNKALQLVKFDGTTETVLASSANNIVPMSAKHTWDLYVKLGASGVVTAYINGAQVVTWTGDLSALTANVDWVRASEQQMSEIIVHTEDTRQMRLQLRAPNSAGDTNTFTAGSYTAVDENPADLSDTVYSGTAAQVFQAKFPALPTAPGGGWIVRARKSTILAAKGLDAGPSSLDFGEKTNGTAYYPTTVALQNGWTPSSIVEETNPATGVRYTAAEAAAIQISLRSA